MRQIKAIKGTFTKERLEKILGKPGWEWRETEDDKPECGLAPGKMWTTGWGSSRACCRIWIHTDGICIGVGQDMPEDRAYAIKVINKVLKKEVK